MGFVIEKDVPIPFAKQGEKSIRATVGRLEVGESFFVPVEPQNKHDKRRALITAAHDHGFKYATRTVEGGLRFWRIG